MKSKLKRLISFFVLAAVFLTSAVIAEASETAEYHVTGGAEVWDGTKPEEMPDYSGEGTADSPYLITDGAELYWAVTNENKDVYFKITNDIVLNNITVRINKVVDGSNVTNIPQVYDSEGNLATDAEGKITAEYKDRFNKWALVDTNAEDWSDAKVFKGILDGGSHIIRGLFYDDVANAADGEFNYIAGLIPYAADAEILNIGIEDAYVYVTNAVGDDPSNPGNRGAKVAVLCGSVTTGRGAVLKNSYLAESVYVTGNIVGGFFGVLEGSYTEGRKEVLFENLYSLATVQEVANSNGRYSGQIVGKGMSLGEYDASDMENGWKNVARNIYAVGSKFIGGGTPFCYNCYTTSADNKGPKVWDPAANDGEGGWGSGTLTEYAPVSFGSNRYQMIGVSASENMSGLGDAFVILPSDYPMLKSLVRRGENEWDGSFDDTLEGSGTEEEPYLISNAGELAWLGYNGGTTAYYKLTCDIYLNDGSKIDKSTGRGIDYTPISWFDSGMIGTELLAYGFDGNGHTVYGLYADFSPYYTKSSKEQTKFEGYTALFPKVRYSRASGKAINISNLGVENSYISNFTGAAAIIGCTNTSSYTANLTMSGCYAGEDVTVVSPVAGVLAADISLNVSVENCYSAADLKSDTGLSGLVANWNTGTKGQTLSITGCYSTGNISGSGNGTTINCYADFAVKGADALAALEGFSSDIWYAVNDENQYPMLRVRGNAINDIDENGIFEPALELAAMRKLLMNGESALNNADTNNDGALDLLDLVRLKKIVSVRAY